ncbi:MAG: type I DNA topoisomerase [Candidatus Nealsonbacteria bacterium]|nr:type I DNA topoisomerase [Candidatus Nealsonbacteria bacterium]
MKLIVVESPAKGVTISKFLGKGYKVLASFGHVRNLPKGKLGVDVDNNFEPQYVIPTKARKTINILKKESAKAEETILATDEDREGESISWHINEVLKLKEPKRIVFHEITKEAIKEAMENPRQIDLNLVNAQQARRILDRIVGYKLSPFLWKKVARGLSAGRVQSVAVRLIAEREKEIQFFTPEEYWEIEAVLKKETKEFSAYLFKIKDKPIDKLEIKNKEEAEKILKELNGAEYIVSNSEKKETKRNPLPPFTTSTLQQEAYKKLRLPAKMTMRIAQSLYESGHITYHRTDSVNLSQQSLIASKSFIENTFGKNYWAGYFRKFKSKGKVQEAHEAIRPTMADASPENFKGDRHQTNLYSLIWKRFIASQMAPAVFDSITADISANEYGFRANGQKLKFDGFLKVYPIKFEEKEIPALDKGEKLDLIKINNSQHFTQPPARYNEASLIKALEENGIGRPSTYAPIISTIQARNYIAKNEARRFYPTEIGITVNSMLVEHFPKIVDIGFTAKMEEELDEIAEGKEIWTDVCKEFYAPFSENLEKKYIDVSKEGVGTKQTDKICPLCGSPVVEKLGRFGRFYACSTFPKCRYTESLKENKLGIKCPKCEKGDITAKRTKRGKVFYGCNKYPECDFALWDKPTGEKCPKCNSLLIETNRKQIKCSNKECDYVKEKERKAE